MALVKRVGPLALGCLLISGACSSNNSSQNNPVDTTALSRTSIGGSLQLALTEEAGLTAAQADYIVQKGYSQTSPALHKFLALTETAAFQTDLKDMTAGVFDALNDAEAGIKAEDMAKIVKLAGKVIADGIDDAAAAESITIDHKQLSSIMESLTKEAISEFSNEEAVKFLAAMTAGFMEGAMVAGDVPADYMATFSQDMMASMVKELGTRKDWKAGDLALVIGQSSEGMMLGIGTSLKTESYDELAKAISQGTMQGAGNFETFDITLLQALAEACSKGVMAATADFTNFDTSFYDELASAASEGILAGAGAVAGFDASYYDELAKSATTGLMSGAGDITGLAKEFYAKIAAAGSAGVMIGASNIGGFDKGLYDELAKASSEGLMAGASAVPNFDATYYDDLAKAATEGLMSGAGDITGLPPELYAVIVEAGAAGVMSGAGGINGFDTATYDDLAKATSEGAILGASSIDNFDKTLIDDLAEGTSAGVMTGAGEIEGLNQSVFNDLASASAQGAVAGAGSFEELSESELATIGRASSTGAVAGAPVGISTTEVQSASTSGTDAGGEMVKLYMECMETGGSWNGQSCVLTPK